MAECTADFLPFPYNGDCSTVCQSRFISGTDKSNREYCKGRKDCVIVGRNADELLRVHHPFNVFVCADMESKIRRCMERAEKNENLSRKELERKIRSIDKNRAEVREIITHKGWGVHTSYHLTVNATDWNLKELTSAVAAFAESWFRRKTHDTAL